MTAAAAAATATACPVCGSASLEPFFEMGRLPALCNALWPDRQAAESAAVGDVELAICSSCAMVTNTRFDPAVFGYSPQYENSLHYSPSFQRFAEEVAHRLVDRYRLHDTAVVEIGPGSGDFLALLCELGGNRGIGFDPSHDPARRRADFPDAVEIRTEHLSTDARLSARLVCARHVLEHVPEVGTVVAAMRRALEPDGVAYVEVPDGGYLLERVALWDVVYEHCHHFTAPALRRLLVASGLRCRHMGVAFGDQFLWAEAALGTADPEAPTGDRAAVDHLRALAHRFGQRTTCELDRAAAAVDALQQRGEVVLWGAGSKGVSFLNMVDGAGAVGRIVDINPHKRGLHVPGTGQQVVSPADLVDEPPAVALVLNPNYVDEIAGQLDAMGLPTTVETLPPAHDDAA